MRKLSADWIFPISSPPIKRGILVFDDQDTLVEIIDNGGNPVEIPSLEFYNGILVPGFVNTHCHLELSYLRNCFPMQSGLPGFIRNIIQHRRPPLDEIQKAIADADALMWEQGIQATGDICNTSFTFQVKERSRIRYHNFIECFDLAGGTTANSFQAVRDLWNDSKSRDIPATIVPHAPYTVSASLFEAIWEHSKTDKGTVCIHNQETPSEDKYMEDGSGALGEFLRSAGVKRDERIPFRGSSIRSYLPLLPKDEKLLLVHNTFITQQDFGAISGERERIYFALCPNANLYIENQLPPLPLLLQWGMHLTVGTDSFASNHSLSVWEEIKTLSVFYPEVSLEVFLEMACLKGAQSLHMEQVLGSFEKGKTPGVLRITGIDLQNFSIRPGSGVERIV